MSPDTRVEVRRSALVGGAAMLLAIGAGAGYVVFAAMHVPAAPTRHVAVAPTPSTAVTSGGTVAGIVVPMTAEARQRAGVALTTVASGAVSRALRRPAVVEANAYRRVAVTPLAAGRVTRVRVELGERVVRGQVLAEVFSPELAEAQAVYVTARAELDAHDRELARVDKLAKLGSASQQELERVTAEHASRRTAAQSAAARLRLLAVSDDAIEHLGAGHTAPATTLQVRAPLAGIVTERPANAGVNVDASTPLATIVDLTSVWAVSDIYEADFRRIRVGTPAIVTTPAYPGFAVPGRVSYIDPQLSAETRTAKVRVDVPNPRQELRLGMLADVSFGGVGGPESTVTIPRAAVQSLADRSVVYVANPANERELLERTVRLGDVSGDSVVVLAGLGPGEQVVTAGSFHVRAERERLGLGDPAPTPPMPPATATATARPRHAGESPQAVTITVSKEGFTPATVTLRAGAPARLTFIRRSEQTCATEIVVPTLKITRPLPLDTPIDIDVTPEKAGTIDFVCGMGMLKGAIVVR
jgi:membrane fusion protein, heavy metal efflux system